MDTLLIVEDEKMIRRGIAVMAQRSSVEIKEIIECRNGEETMEILKNRKINTVFTDIRMPKMDGIELVKEMENLEHKPDVVVVSGYEDFNYAVVMMKHGVADYILKPVKRDKIEEILEKLEEKQKLNCRNYQIQKQMLYSQLRYYLTEEILESDCWEIIRQWEKCFREEPYLALVFSERSAETEEEGCFCIDHVRKQKAVFIPEKSYGEWEKKTKAEFYGISLPARGFKECKRAFEQAEHARKKAFVTGSLFCFYEEESHDENGDEEAEQFVQQFSGSGRNTAVKDLLNRCFQARHGEEDPYKLLNDIQKILKKLAVFYRTLIQEKEILAYEEPLLWNTLEEYEPCLKMWLERLGGCIDVKFSSDQNKRKIQEAVSYIRENYTRDLNMAMVSNYVSMNYSLFSIEFKNYTGMNFVNYLKEIRIKTAKRLLENTELRIQEVGKMVGYENDKHFMKIFKNICGVSPSEYRKMKTSMKQ